MVQAEAMCVFAGGVFFLLQKNFSFSFLFYKTFVDKEKLKKSQHRERKIFREKNKQDKSNSGPDYQNVFTSGFVFIRWL